MNTNGRHIQPPQSSASYPKTVRIKTLPLESGHRLKDAPVAYRTWGKLNDDGSNAVVVCHALTGSSDVAAWWPGIVGPGLSIDTNRFFVICPNTLGSPYGSASPLTPDPSTGQPYGPRFPDITIRDTVNAHRKLLEGIGVRRVVAVVGASMGGMQVLEWAFHSDLVKSLIPIAVGGRHSPWCIGWSEAQRQAIFADANWNDGYYVPESPPAAGLAAARMMAMISYRSQEEFADRFGRNTMPADDTAHRTLFAAESYLQHQGQKLVSRFDANCYVHLTRQMDTHDVSRGRGEYHRVLQSIRQPTLIVGISTDVLYPLVEQIELAETLPHATLHVLDSPYGHDSFLIETEFMSRLIGDWLDARSGRQSRDGKERSVSNRLDSVVSWKPLVRSDGEQAA